MPRKCMRGYDCECRRTPLLRAAGLYFGERRKKKKEKEIIISIIKKLSRVELAKDGTLHFPPPFFQNHHDRKSSFQGPYSNACTFCHRCILLIYNYPGGLC